MKIITSVTVHHRAKPDADVDVLAPGRHDLPDDVAKGLLARGFAKTQAEADAEAAAEEGGVQVKTDGKGVKIKGQ